MWEGYITSPSVVVQNINFLNKQENNSIMPGFIYLHQTKKYIEHIAMLQKLKNAINLSFSASSKIFVVTDRKAPLIKAWQEVFPYMHYLLCANHFMKNI
jgi:hypothetical protein